MRSEERQPRSQPEKCSLRLAITDHHLIQIVSDAQTRGRYLSMRPLTPFVFDQVPRIYYAHYRVVWA